MSPPVRPIVPDWHHARSGIDDFRKTFVISVTPITAMVMAVEP
jgi:hypothetical protein